MTMNEISAFVLPVLDRSLGDKRSRITQSGPDRGYCSLLTSPSPLLLHYNSPSAAALSAFTPPPPTPVFISLSKISLLLLCLSHNIPSSYPILSRFLLLPFSSPSSSCLPLPSPCMERQLTASLLSSTVPLSPLSFCLWSFSGCVTLQPLC